MEDIMDIKLEWVIPREKGARRCMDKRVLQNNCTSKTWETRGKGNVFRRQVSQALTRLPSYHSSRMRISAATIRLLHLSYRTNANVLPSPSFRTPFFSLITPFWFVPRDKAETCPRPLCLSRGRSAASAREAKRLVQRRDRQQSRALYRRVLIKFNVVERN